MPRHLLHPGARVLERVVQGLCLEFPHAVNGDGYGTVWDSSAGHAVKAHIAVREYLVGPIERHPDTGHRFPIDHLCRNRLCVDPDHLEVVTVRINTLRGYGPTAMRARARQAQLTGQLRLAI